jgi:hypothetical protein
VLQNSDLICGFSDLDCPEPAVLRRNGSRPAPRNKVRGLKAHEMTNHASACTQFDYSLESGVQGSRSGCGPGFLRFRGNDGQKYWYREIHFVSASKRGKRALIEREICRRT